MGSFIGHPAYFNADGTERRIFNRGRLDSILWKERKKKKERKEREKQNLTVQLEWKGFINASLPGSTRYVRCRPLTGNTLPFLSPPPPLPLFRFFSFPCVRQFALFDFLSFLSSNGEPVKIVNSRSFFSSSRPLSLSTEQRCIFFMILTFSIQVYVSKMSKSRRGTSAAFLRRAISLQSLH